MRLPRPLVTIDWLRQHLDHENIVILDATIPKVGQKNFLPIGQSLVVPGTRFFDLKGTFLDTESELPNTKPKPIQFEEGCRQLGISENSLIVVYDRHGVYSSPRAWWLLKSMGHQNVSILNGGLPAWVEANLETTEYIQYSGSPGDFKSNYKEDSFKTRLEVLNMMENPQYRILDARSSGRFDGTSPEPRQGLMSGHIPNSVNLPHKQLTNGPFLKQKDQLKDIFSIKTESSQTLVCTCGSGISACIIALAAETAGYNHVSVYDGSWSDWGLHGPVAT